MPPYISHYTQPHTIYTHYLALLLALPLLVADTAQNYLSFSCEGPHPNAMTIVRGDITDQAAF